MQIKVLLSVCVGVVVKEVGWGVKIFALKSYKVENINRFDFFCPKHMFYNIW